MEDILVELQQKVAMKPSLEAKLRELQNQRRKYDREDLPSAFTGCCYYPSFLPFWIDFTSLSGAT